jgi:hypothetical protein
MEGTMTSPTAVLVRPEDAGGRPHSATISVAREEIEEALASDDAPELILEIQLRETERRELHVAWERSDLESILAGASPGRIAFSFEPSELSRALDNPDFEGHGFREAILLTVAAASASAAVAASTAQGGIAEGTGVGGGAAATLVSPGHAEAGTAAALTSLAATKDEAGSTARGIGVTIPGADEATLAARGIDPPVAAVGHDEALTGSALSSTTANDELGGTARGIGVTIPGAEEATLAARGIEAQPIPVAHDEATLVQRGLEPAPVTVDSGTGLDLPSVDAGTAALVGGLAGASLLLIVGGTFATRRRPTGTA